MARIEQANGSTHDTILWALGEVTASQRHILVEMEHVRERLDEGEKRMDFLSEENIRRQLEVRTPMEEKDKRSSTERMVIAILDFTKEVVGSKRDVKLWIILLAMAWAANALHLPKEWQEGLLHRATEQSE